MNEQPDNLIEDKDFALLLEEGVYIEGTFMGIATSGRHCYNCKCNAGGGMFASVAPSVIGQLFVNQEKKLAKDQITRIRKVREQSTAKLQQLHCELQITEEQLQAANKELIDTNKALADSLSELEMAKEKLQESEELYRSLLETVPDYIVKTDIRGKITYVNDHVLDRLQDNLGKSIVGRNILSFIASEDLPRALENSRLMLEKKLGVKEYRMNLDGITSVDVEVNGDVMHDKYGNPSGLVFVLRDITERKNMEKEMQQKALLEKRIAVTEESLKFKQNFLANMSHEIRTPLFGVLGMIDFLEQTQLSVIQKEYLTTLKVSGQNLREIINQILDYSKIEAGKVSINPQVFEYKSLIDNSLLLYKSCTNPGVLLNSDVSLEIPNHIEADKIRLTQVLNNFLSNAVKFTQQGSISINSSLVSGKTEKNNVLIKVEVTDTGIGIADELQKSLFVPFSQIEAMDTQYYEGTGLGLSISKQLIEMMGGQVGMSSKQGVGSTFWFTFPAAIAHKPENAFDEKAENKKNRPLHILLAEDKILNQKVISLILNSLGHVVEMASNGEEAIEIFEPGKFDIILMDIQMPVMDGVTATRLLKERYRELPPIVGLSANAFEGDRENFMQKGLDDYLTKPFKKDDFEKLVNILLKL